MRCFAWILRSLPLFLLLAASPAGAAEEDPRDKAAVNEVLQSVLETEKSGVQVPWSSAVTGNAGKIEVIRTYFPSPERPCRDYVRTTITPDGRKTSVHGTGCRVGPEEWTLDEKPPVSEGTAGATEKSRKAKKDAAPPEKTIAAPKPAEEPAAAPDKTAKAEPPKPAPKAVEKPAPPLLEYSLPTSSTI